MEIYISMGKDRLRLPVLPEEVGTSVANQNQTININAIGEINLIGKTGLRELSLSSFFPAQNYYFNEYNNPPKPLEFVNKLDKWRESGDPVRVIITGTPVNQEMSIESFEPMERDGTGDVYYTLELKEYKRLKVKKSRTAAKKPLAKRPVPAKPKRKTYVVKRGDNLWNIAKKHTGNAMNYKKIAKDNNIKNANLIYPGQKLIL